MKSATHKLKTAAYGRTPSQRSHGSLRLPLKQQAIYTRQLATLLRAGVPIVPALRVLEKQKQKGHLTTIISAQITCLEAGNPFSASLRAWPGVFDSMYCSLVVAGEKAGRLEQVLGRLAHYLERMLQTRGKVKAAMTYPVVVLIASFGIVAGLLVFVVPQFEEIFESMLQGAPLPPMTQWVLAASRLVQEHWVASAMFLGLTYATWYALLRFPRFMRLVHWIQISVPFFGLPYKQSLLARFCRTLGTLLDSAVPILSAIETASDTVHNRPLNDVFDRTRSRVLEGSPVAGALEIEPLMPPVLVGMIEVGETTGDLSSMLTQIAKTYEEEVEVSVEGMTTLIEPVMILLLAGMVGFLVIALFLPIVEIMQHLGN
jgi:type IV pilus assembly protein PilC